MKDTWFKEHLAGAKEALPFAWTVNTRKLPMLHADLDYPVRQEFWTMP
jgi:hypothetical protein